MAGTKGGKPGGGSPAQKPSLGKGRSLQLDDVKSESLRIADQNAGMNTFPGLVHTARNTTKADCTLSRCASRKEAGTHGMVGNWGEVV